MPDYLFATTPLLDVAYLEWNPEGARTAVLLHGWPDSPACWSAVAPALADAGYRVLAPALRGFAPTRFRCAATPRSGQLAALGRDLLDFVDALRLESPVLVGHDWGARAAANACGLRERAASHLAMLSVGYGTNDPNQPLSLLQARNYWYHWFMATPRGERAVRDDRRAFARTMWDTWAPAGWYAPQDFDEAANAFDGPDWADVVLHSYRHRWGFASGDAAYADDEARLNPAPVLAVPTLVLHGGADTCNHPDSSASRERFFAGRYERVVLDGIGHFPQREAAARVAGAIVAFCADADA
ncbi:alpha/beta hydrolase [Burkholderia pseudomallei]|uniref:alpha/beta fold hydrolase n=1 Tax=Burkholderia pseudomallei TaxID=28450 RepID=UPI000537A3B7|nr:alpha/beta hydrolase [Burkholderia pseudomallei]KGU81096.1 alpha/beta hydrolase fold family protein [Burkholderia pseudomallei MSHR543]KGV16030.1 alpha/beta hydrolase fold family protein [Burkholderia pseudomallei MSHR4300]KJR95100.1 alpha/beta hydrolase [Burkholderia pseudomallei]MDA5593374.1 alpha/beta hydrolase [Burkholderia pseudomallei]OMW28109.1 alpha/beta hydrolase [Burkholderia pseudomallei]